LEGKEGGQAQDDQTNEGTNDSTGNGSNILGSFSVASGGAARSGSVLCSSEITLLTRALNSITTNRAGGVVSTADTAGIISRMSVGGSGTVNNALAGIAKVARVGQLLGISSKADSAAILVRVPGVVGGGADTTVIQGIVVIQITGAATAVVISNDGSTNIASRGAVIAAGGGIASRTLRGESGASAGNSLRILSS